MAYAGKYIDKAKEVGDVLVDQAKKAKENFLKNEDDK